MNRTLRLFVIYYWYLLIFVFTRILYNVLYIAYAPLIVLMSINNGLFNVIIQYTRIIITSTANPVTYHTNRRNNKTSTILYKNTGILLFHQTMYNLLIIR